MWTSYTSFSLSLLGPEMPFFGAKKQQPGCSWLPCFSFTPWQPCRTPSPAGVFSQKKYHSIYIPTKPGSCERDKKKRKHGVYTPWKINGWFNQKSSNWNPESRHLSFKTSFAPVQHANFLPVRGYNLTILKFASLMLGETVEKSSQMVMNHGTKQQKIILNKSKT